MINIKNFTGVVLSRPLKRTDTVMYLAPGQGAKLDIPAGDYVYLTLVDRVDTEIVLYKSTGILVGDVVPILRAQDGTVAGHFPAGTCVSISWNVKQLSEYISKVISDYFSAACPPSEIVRMTTRPSTPPTGCIKYAVNTAVTPAEFFFYEATRGWVQVNGGITPTRPPITQQFDSYGIAIAPNCGLFVNNLGQLDIDCRALYTRCGVNGGVAATTEYTLTGSPNSKIFADTDTECFDFVLTDENGQPVPNKQIEFAISTIDLSEVV